MAIGAWAALTAAFLWTCSSLLWSKLELPAMLLNMLKNGLGLVLVFCHLSVVQLGFGRSLFNAPLSSWCWLGLSGLVGVVVGDTLYFRCLQILGPRLSLMVATSSPLFAALIAMAFLQVDVAPLIVSGVLLTVIGVTVVIADRQSKDEAPGLQPGSRRWGILAGVLGAICQAIGGACSNLGMKSGDIEICSALEATVIRLLIASVFTTIFVFARRDLLRKLNAVRSWNVFRLILAATIVGTWLGIFFSQIAYQKADLPVAQTLLSTCPLFAIPLIWLTEGKGVTWVGVVGTLMAFLGIYLMTS